MTLRTHLCRRVAPVLSAVAWLLLLLAGPLLGDEIAIAGASNDPSAPIPGDLFERFRRLEESQRSLIEDNRRLSSQLKVLSATHRPSMTDAASDASLVPPSPDSPLMGFGVVPQVDQSLGGSANLTTQSFDTADEFPREERLLSSGSKTSAFFASFDRGFVIRPIDPEQTPFELKISGQNQIRYVGFDKQDGTWTDSSGVVTPLSNQSNFQIPRGRLIFSGYAFRQELLYNLNIDYNTVGNSQINFRAYWLAWRFSRAMTVYAGQSKVPGGREWLLSFVDTQGVDRSMATTFFRPSLSQGIWATGEPADHVFYHVMMSNGFNTLGSTPQQLNSLMAFSGSLWHEPLGDFGRGYSDFEWHTEPSVRYGASLTYAPEEGPQGASSAPENSLIRLSDGTLITNTGALAPGVTLNAFKIGLLSVDFAYKHRGFSMSGEFYSQELFALQPSGPIPRSSIYQFGGFAQAGYFCIPQKLEPYLRTSQVMGPYGAGSEYAGGFNWFFLPGKQNLRFTFDAAWLNNCPADQNRTNYVAGQTGILVRSQIQLYF